MKRLIHPVRFWGLFVLLVVIAFVSLWQRDRVHRMGYVIQDLQREKAQRMKLHKELLVEVARFSALDRIEAVATTQLAMGPASPTERIYVKLPSGRNKN